MQEVLRGMNTISGYRPKDGRGVEGNAGWAQDVKTDYSWWFLERSIRLSLVWWVTVPKGWLPSVLMGTGRGNRTLSMSNCHERHLLWSQWMQPGCSNPLSAVSGCDRKGEQFSGWTYQYFLCCWLDWACGRLSDWLDRSISRDSPGSGAGVPPAWLVMLICMGSGSRPWCGHGICGH